VSNVKIVTPEETTELLAQGYTYIDVRSEPEFAAGHVPGAVNVPISHAGPAGLVPNADFLAVMQGAFEKDERLVVGCKMGGRSAKAAAALAQAGYSNLCDMSAGFDGKRDPFGRMTPGWNGAGRAVETTANAEQTYAEVRKKAGV
jgi:rhodanese-related sulfurtransferase